MRQSGVGARRGRSIATRWLSGHLFIAIATVSVGAAHAQQSGGVVGGVVGGLAEAPPPPPPPGVPIRVGGNIRPPQKIKHVNPQYPSIAQSARVQGVVIIEATISATGDVSNARVLRSIPLLDQAALDAVRQWQFQPTLFNGSPVAVIMTVTVQFTLSNDAFPRPCSLESSFKSPESALATSFRFVNQSAQSRKLYRLDANGQREWVMTLGETADVEQPTFVGHAWLVANDKDDCLGIYLAAPGPLRVPLRP
jgi:TonB family protein